MLLNCGVGEDYIFLGSKIIAAGDCSHEIKRHLLLGRKAMTNLDSTLKGRDITLPTKVRLVKAIVFPVVMYGLKKELATHSSILTWRIPWEKKSLVGYSPWGCYSRSSSNSKWMQKL